MILGLGVLAGPLSVNSETKIGWDFFFRGVSNKANPNRLRLRWWLFELRALSISLSSRTLSVWDNQYNNCKYIQTKNIHIREHQQTYSASSTRSIELNMYMYLGKFFWAK